MRSEEEHLGKPKVKRGDKNRIQEEFKDSGLYKLQSKSISLPEFLLLDTECLAFRKIFQGLPNGKKKQSK